MSTWSQWSGRQQAGTRVEIGPGTEFLATRDCNRTEKLPYRDHSCPLGNAFPEYRPAFGGSVGHRRYGGLAGHGIQLKLYLGLNVPRVHPNRLYSCEVPVSCQFVVDGAPAFFWGDEITVAGTVVVGWGAVSSVSCPFEVLSTRLSVLRSVLPTASLKCDPIQVEVCPSFGPREDVTMGHAVLRWVGTQWPPSSLAKEPEFWAVPRDARCR